MKSVSESDFAVTALLLLASLGRASSMREATTVRSLSASSRPAQNAHRLAGILKHRNYCLILMQCPLCLGGWGKRIAFAQVCLSWDTQWHEHPASVRHLCKGSLSAVLVLLVAEYKTHIYSLKLLHMTLSCQNDTITMRAVPLKASSRRLIARRAKRMRSCAPVKASSRRNDSQM